MCLLAHLFKGSVVLTWGKILRMFLFLLLKGIFSDNFLFSFVQGIKSSKCRLEIDGMYLFAMICDCKKSKAMNCGQYANHDSCETKKFFFHCVVPENIQTPTTEGIGNSRGVGGSEAQEIPERRGVGP